MKKVDSSHIHSIGYDEATAVMTIKFTNGATHEYPRTSRSDHSALMAAKSIGGHFAKHFRQRKNNKLGEK